MRAASSLRVKSCGLNFLRSNFLCPNFFYARTFYARSSCSDFFSRELFMPEVFGAPFPENFANNDLDSEAWKGWRDSNANFLFLQQAGLGKPCQ